MDLAIIGAGKVGAVLGQRWGAAGHTITFGVRQVDHPPVVAAVARAGPGASATTNAEAAAKAQVIILATPWEATQSAIATLGDLTGKIIIDCTNPLLPAFEGLSIGTTTSAGEQVAEWAHGAQVVKTLNTTGSGNMRAPTYPSGSLGMFLCGDDAAAKQVVSTLLREIGFTPIDAGRLAVARYLEPLAMLWIHLAFRERFGSDFALTLVRRETATND